MTELEAHLDDTTSTAIEHLERLIAVRSVSARGEYLAEGAAAFATLLEECGLQTTVWESGGAPVVFAHHAARPGKPTVLIYGHYDVQPPDPIDEWRSDPFEGVLRDGAIYGRGAADNKGQLLAHIMGVALLRRLDGLDIGIKFLIEGEEEIGSPHIAQVAERHRHELSADLALTSDAPFHDDGTPVVIFGVRGLLYVELEAQGANRDVHSGNRGGIAPTPAWELVAALDSMRDSHGDVRIAGFYDDIRSPSALERELLRGLPFDRQALRSELGLARLPPQAEEDPAHALMFSPTFNIAGLTSGYGGPGAKTIVPSRASCKLDLRLVADQDPDRIFASIEAHLHERFPAIRLTKLASVPPSATSPATPFAEPVIAAVSRACGQPPLLRPRLGGTTPDFVFTRVLGMPSLLIPYGQPGMNHHAPNEHITVAAVRRGIACTVEICETLGYGEATQKASNAGETVPGGAPARSRSDTSGVAAQAPGRRLAST